MKTNLPGPELQRVPRWTRKSGRKNRPSLSSPRGSSRKRSSVSGSRPKRPWPSPSSFTKALTSARTGAPASSPTCAPTPCASAPRPLSQARAKIKELFGAGLFAGHAQCLQVAQGGPGSARGHPAHAHRPAAGQDQTVPHARAIQTLQDDLRALPRQPDETRDF